MFYFPRLLESLQTWRTQLLVLAAILLAQTCLLALVRRLGRMTFPRRPLFSVTALATPCTAAVGAYAWHQANTLPLRIPFHRLSDSSIQYIVPVGVAALKAVVPIFLIGASALILLNLVLLVLLASSALHQRLRPIQPAT